MDLSLEQKLAFDKYIHGENIFITGPGGCGKSELIRHIYRHATQNNKQIQVTALTGCAAILLNCNAKTLHSWAGIGIGNKSNEFLIKKVKGNKFSKKMWKTTDILIVDEVSMLSMKMFDTLNIIGKRVRGVMDAPFGGIQLIFSGDFFQLPPVGDRDDIASQSFCFESDEWKNVFPHSSIIQLHKIFRQTDNEYTTILNQIRKGEIKQKTCRILEKYIHRKIPADLVSEPTKLFPIRSMVDTINNNKMTLLTGIEKTYSIKHMNHIDTSEKNEKMKNTFTKEEKLYELEYLANNLMCDKEIKLKVGAQVMCIVNIQDEQDKHIRLCNGSQGIVTRFCETSGLPIVKFNNGIEEIMQPHVWISEKIPGIGVSQLPLILAWALTIHKSQGTTLDMAEIDVGNNIFECGQTYVALSRVKSLEGLYLTSFNVSRIKINKKAKDFYDSIEGINV